MYSSTWSLKITLFHLPAPNIEQFSTRGREGEERKVLVEIEQAQKQPAVAETFAPTSVTNFGNHALSSDLENNQAFFNEYEVHLCVRGIWFELM